MQKILVMGLPGAGKTCLAQSIYNNLQNKQQKVGWLNADQVRKKYDDWDFSREGRIRQSKRMSNLAETEYADMDFVICDFIAPLIEMRNNFNADWTIWVDTIKQGRFEDTNQMFESPESCDFRIKEQNAQKWGEVICSRILENRVTK